MTAATLTGVVQPDTDTDAEHLAVADYAVAVCYVCSGPCLTWKGSVHGFTCRGCLRRYMADQVARADERERRELRAVKINLAATGNTPAAGPLLPAAGGSGGRHRGSGGDGFGPTTAPGAAR